ncbi:MAG TPA: penicillin-binding protein 2 [Acidimicrobiales bacterium]
MAKQIRNLGLFFAVIYVALFVRVNQLTVFQAEELQDKPGNNRAVERDFSRPRGSMTTADGVVIAESVPSDDRFELQRVYPQGELFAHVTGYFSLALSSSGLEDTYNDELYGRDHDLDLRDISDLFVRHEQIGDLTLNIRADVQQAARDALGDRQGSVVALNPQTGDVLALWSNPTYDPNALANHDNRAATAAAQALDADPEKPRLSRAYQELFPPGSTFKIVTSTAGVERGGVTQDQPVYPTLTQYSAPGTGAPIPNFGGSACGGTLFEILQQSCNTSFAQMGAEDVGPDGMIETAQGFGFNDEVPVDLPRPATSVFPTDLDDDSLAFVAQSAIGQYEVRATPLQMALVAAAVANDGEIMTPHLVHEVRDDQGDVIDTIGPDSWRRAMEPDTAGLLREAMRSVVSDGSAQRLDDGLENFDVGGKTGTAQIGSTGLVNTWIIGFAGPQGGDPEVAVAVVVQDQQGVSESTGGRVAAPIGNQVLQVALRPPAGEGSGEG